MLGYCLVNQSSDAQVTSDVVSQIGVALGAQQKDISTAWQRTALSVAVATSPAAVPEGFVPATILYQLDDPDALAYHSVDSSGKPYISIGWGIIKSNGGTLLSGADSLSAAISHEFCEAFCDPYCDDWWDLPDGSGEIPIEACDSVQGYFYEIGGVAVSDFLWPRYFSSEAGQLCQTGQLTVAGALGKGGYYTKRVGGPSGTTSNVFGARVLDGGMPLWKRYAKTLPGSRASIRRGISNGWKTAA